ncbi:phosphoglycerate mutase (2,3-diphosphoglycerate-independent) [Candidatus Roizmanbacteria bacterium RIFCSPHIGHO2_02_FULL_37_15]|uniref:2,3-bisphosphoglycerate-independent phosphoglycerate mutase n=1 Tax=Candidatus Roizmanbacteria bacterium RIFCSPLOWO2_01_FULL_37_16 TaxID=1802058 RepID=A0A1F7IKP8_9BACT|nr:MAG: phosphoglycerate mutase (2,3-diphosphoglycerate-independent) [Candidatus Roizmanbacteria bacterium RIFCSPHIGHO2_01_FULL_37_16b]OGK22009.1 MAG: phosphoglycerate mutase (2,3-diphosphoglycerate-independent) [Candidatus Roizmanbacteria bacterium RIFCSPHIGHO2_02_FULL_37_15]OGK31770.1 MAG: phosphoglycerate mutase (2,3-diphosphoglycerate-independent) [Candidatus Roizmanbacteria bacterium RIFCSPHIGHO2_12_FULL_36_11]OGK43930.1 MAG: phosphoglycerate mutase (2,3-diphosphoglycerate-independent) [Can
MTPVILIVLDGFGLASHLPGNAIYLANPQNINSLLYSYPNTTLKASGQAVGLPADEVGNTEVGHLNLGAGRIVYQDLPRINMAIADGSFYKNSVFQEALSHAKKNKSNLHLIGLVGEGSVHSSVDHLYALLYLMKEQNLEKVYLHLITDGRDSPPKSALGSVKSLKEKLDSLKIGIIASIMGRYYAMDRDRRWERTEKAYECLIKGSVNKTQSVISTIEDSYRQGRTDEFIEPTNIVNPNGEPIVLIKENDAIIFFNYRIDRPRQLTKAFVLENFEQDANKTLSFDPYAIKYYKSHLHQEEILTPPFQRSPKLNNLYFVTMTEYEKNLAVKVAFPPIRVHTPLGKVISEAGFSQLRMAESEKERFVTFYFNGQNEASFAQEERLIIPSPKVPTYDTKPEMSAHELTNVLISKLREKKYHFILVNFANPDMVGHTGNIEATTKAIKVIDECLGKIVREALILNYYLLITADHGNAEQKINPQTGEISTEHTNNPVPFVAVGNKFLGRFIKLQTGILADVAPTILSLLELPKPQDMTGRNLLEEIS